MGQGPSWARRATAYGPALSLLRKPQSFRSPAVLHPSCLGVEAKSKRRVRELAPKRLLRGIFRPDSVKQQNTTTWRNHNDATFTSRYHRSEEHTSELQSQSNLVCRLLL